MSCDICGKKGTPLADLLDVYKTDEVKAICYDCEKVVNARNGVLLTWALRLKSVLLKRYIKERQETFTKGPQQ
jgi:hypothetical protein